ncbi:hypothetical protein F0562_011097 [Nyssa sinensis]|uniref:Sugar phosphate transporter domain-containing protein n=1 Tax=Nyssa sinensis TaxID=561372 RepID=A0A5J5A392_9ASTE|nr:hypothetical protein F0562_011097 [Nyssa sinensis]
MLVSWALKISEAPKINSEFWKTLFPVAVAHTIGHVAAMVSMSIVAISLTHIVKSGEPAFSVLVSRFLLGETFPVLVYLSLVPIIGGCALAAVTELNFNMTIERENIVMLIQLFYGGYDIKFGICVPEHILKERHEGEVCGWNELFACLSMLSLLILTAFSIAVEGPQVWAVGWQRVVSLIGPNFIWWVVAQSVFYHLGFLSLSPPLSSSSAHLSNESMHLELPSQSLEPFCIHRQNSKKFEARGLKSKKPTVTIIPACPPSMMNKQWKYHEEDCHSLLHGASNLWNFSTFTGLFPIVGALEECGSRPRKVAKTAKPMKGEYIVNSLSDAL